MCHRHERRCAFRFTIQIKTLAETKVQVDLKKMSKREKIVQRKEDMPPRLFNRLQYGFCLLAIVIAVVINPRLGEVFLSSKNSSDIVTKATSEAHVVRSASVKPKYVLYNAHGKKDHLRHVEIVLQRFGYEEAPFNASSSDWNLMWAHDYPFNTLKQIDFKKLKPCQRVNHIPGCGYITNKVDLSTTRLKERQHYFPRAFKLPQQKQELLNYAEQNPDKLFVHKHNQHRHIRVRSLKDINFEDTNNFVQEFVGNPLLIDGYKFDIGVYTVITSVDPLRVYYYTGDILFRFCPVKYEPFDADNVNKYIVGDDYLPIWKVPSLSKYYNTQKHGMRDSFNLHMRADGRDPNIIWQQVEDSIRLMIYEKETHLKDILTRYGASKRNFFELMRIDFVVDADFNVYSMSRLKQIWTVFILPFFSDGSKHESQPICSPLSTKPTTV